MARIEADDVPTPSSVPAPRAFVLEKLATLWTFVRDYCIPAEEEVEAFLGAVAPAGDRRRFDVVPPSIDSLKRRARALGLWNVWADKHMCELARARASAGDGPCGAKLAEEIVAELPSEPLTVAEYAILADVMGRSDLASVACNW